MSSPSSSEPGSLEEQAERVALALSAYERSISDARTKALSLGIILLEAQSNRALSATVGRQALASITASQAGLDDALKHADAAHRVIAHLARYLGIDPSAYGEQKGPGDKF